VFKHTLYAVIAVAVAAGALVSCSDDEWDVELFLWPPQERTVSHGEIKVYPVQGGKYETVVVRLWGSRYEMGYAHGQLLGSQIVVLITENLVKELGRENYEGLCADAEANFEWPKEANIELDAMLAGMRDDGRNLWVEELDRELDVRDLKAWNAYPDLVAPALPGGQAFALWEDASEYRTPLVARNFEMYPGAERYLASTWPVLAYRSEGVPIASVAPPGYIGVLTGISKTGVSAYAIGGDGDRGGTGGWPVGLILRKFLASSEHPGRADAELTNLAQELNHYGSWNLLAVSPIRFASRTEYPEFACVVECDTAGVATRFGESVWPRNRDKIFVTGSHRLLKGTPGQGSDPVYDKLVSKVTDILKREAFTETQGQEVLFEVAGRNNLHSLISFTTKDGTFVMLAVSDGDVSAARTGGYRYFGWRDFWPE